MTGTVAWVLLGLTAGAALVDWFAVAFGRVAVEYVAKPLTTAGLIALACTLDPVHADMRVAFVVALVLSLAGDVLLMLPGEKWFTFGLGAFLFAHLAYVVGFALGPGTGAELAVGALITLVVAVPLGVRLLRAVRRTRPALVRPVAAYVTVIAVMVACATGWGNAWAIVGAWLFFASDALIGETRFVRAGRDDTRWGPLAIIVTYHLGQAGLVLSLVHH